MTDTDPIKKLDDAVAGDSDGVANTDFAEEYPDAPEWAKQLAQRVERADARLDERDREREQKHQDLRRKLQARVAALATDAGVATTEEKDLVAKARGATDGSPGSLDSLAKHLSTTDPTDTHP